MTSLWSSFAFCQWNVPNNFHFKQLEWMELKTTFLKVSFKWLLFFFFCSVVYKPTAKCCGLRIKQHIDPSYCGWGTGLGISFFSFFFLNCASSSNSKYYLCPLILFYILFEFLIFFLTQGTKFSSIPFDTYRDRF